MRRSTFGLLALFLFSFSINGLLDAALPLWMRSRGVTIAEIGVAFSVLPLVYQGLRLVFSAVADRIGVRIFLFLSGLSQLAALGLYYSAPSSLFYLAGKLFEGIARSALRGVDKQLVFADADAASAGRIAGNYSAMLWYGVGIGGFAAGVLLSSLGFGAVFALIALIATVFVLMPLGLVEERAERISMRELLAHALGFRGLGERIKRLTFVLLFDGLGRGLTTTFVIVLLFREFYGWETAWIGLLLLLYHVLAGFVSMRFGFVADRVENRRLFNALSLGLVLTLGASAWLVSLGASAETAAAVALLLILMNISFGWRSAPINRMAVLASEKANLGRDMNFVLTGFWLGKFVGIGAAGLLIQWYGYPSVLFSAAVLQLLAGALIFLV